jgi:DNA polymerase III delta subunit
VKNSISAPVRCGPFMAKLEPLTPDQIMARIGEGDVGPLYLVVGDRVLAEPAAVRIGEELARRSGCEAEVHRRPAELGPLLADLKTYSLFAPAKIVVAVETAVLADATAAARLIDEALEAGSVELDEDQALSERQRRSACRLMQTLRLFQLDSASGSAVEIVAALPDSVLQGAARSGGRRRRRGRRQIEEARNQLAQLLAAARTAGLEGWAETELVELADIAQRGLPEGHSLVLAESAADRAHPLVDSLATAGRYAAVGQVEAAKGGGWEGLDLLAAELGRETGVAIARPALQELARRTIQRREVRGAAATVNADSTTRFAAEYRKLATLVGEGQIGPELVENVVEDRGEEDAWKILDAVGAGRADEALQRIQRLLAAAEDPVAARLSFFALLAGFSRQLVALCSLTEELGIPRHSVSYANFKKQIAPRLQADFADGSASPVAGLHPYRLYRAFTVASRVPAAMVRDLPARVLETELRLKGESSQPDVALSSFVCDLAVVARGRV